MVARVSMMIFEIINVDIILVFFLLSIERYGPLHIAWPELASAGMCVC